MPENTNIKVKKGTTLIARYAFDGCENLTGINIPKSLAELKTKEKRFDRCCAKEEMLNVVNDMLELK